MTRLTALDTAFLAFEGPHTPAHVGSVSVFEGEPLRDERGRIDIEALRTGIEARLHLVPRLRQVVADPPLGLAHPVLVDDADFDIAHHVKLVELGPGAGEAELFDLACDLHMELLDRHRPLWELWFVDGLEDGSVGMVEKIHHAIVDGVSGVEVATVLLDLERGAPAHTGPEFVPERRPSAAALALDAVRESARRPIDMAADAVTAARHPAERVQRWVNEARSLTAFAASASPAPRCSLNDDVGARRRLVAVRRDLEAVRAAAHDHGGTVNDIVLAAVAGGLRQLLDHRQELPADPSFVLRALVPVSLHTGGDLGNRVAGLVVPLPVGRAEPTDRLDEVMADMAERKRHDEAAASSVLLDGADLLPTVLTRGVSRLVHHQPFVNVVVTNVPGPQFPLYAAGAEMLDAVPIVPLAGNLTVSIGILSYNGALVVALYGDADAMGDDLDLLASGIGDDLDALQRAAV